MTHLHIDFETRSTVDLKVAGLHRYATDPTTEPWCMTYAFGDAGVAIWYPGANPIVVSAVMDFVRKGGIVYAHNAAFELAIWNHICVPRYGWPPLRPEQTRCTMAMAYAMALPGSLENAAAAVGLDMQKDKAGHRLMMQMAKPKADGGWWDNAAKLEALYEYCRQDVRVERELAKRLMPLSDDEQALWVLDQRINNRGVGIDRASVEAAIAVVQSEQDRLNLAMREATGNFVGFCTEHARITKWVQSRGVPTEGVAKADVVDLLARDDLPPDVRRVLLLRQEAGKTSTAKLRAMIDACSDDGRLRGVLQYHGAGTGRWAGRRVQLHNMPRPKIGHADIEQVFGVLGGVE